MAAFQVFTEAQKEFKARPEMHKQDASKPETTKTETAAPSGKQFLIENISPNMTKEQENNCWAAIQRAVGIEPGKGRYRHE